MRTFAQKPKTTQPTTPAKSTTPGRARFRQSREVNSILHLQRTVGNQAVQRMLQTNVEEFKAGLTGTESPRFGHDFSRIPMHSPAAAAIQTKLAINKPGDIYEQEADRVSEQVMGMPEPELQRACACGGSCSECQTEQPGQEHQPLQTKHVGSSGSGQTAAPPIVHEALASPGQPLDPATRAFMEPRFGHDFSRVRVHSDAVAERSAQDVNAHAYTVGHDIVFGAGWFAPGTHQGRRLIAHELTHVVQQGSELRRMILGSGKGPQDVLREVPDEERPRVLGAIARVRKVAKDRKGYANCHKSYAETCPGGNASSLENAFDTAVLWRVAPGERLGTGAITFCEKLEGSPDWDRRTVGYSDTGYNAGESVLAYYFLHELGHVCGISCPDVSHHLADKLALYCMGPLADDQDNPLLHEWRAGRLSLRLNTDLNVMGALRGLQELTGEQAPAGEIGGATFSLRMRPFSGEHFGGLSFHAGLGGQFGRFRVRPPTASDPADIRSDAALVVEVGSRIEWWVKDEEMTTASGEIGRVKPRAIDLSYRLIQPATTGARRAHEFLASYVLHF
jgi:hypothetical protein